MPSVPVFDVKAGSLARATASVIGMLLGLTLLTACRNGNGTVLGKEPGSEIRNIIAIRAGETPSHVSLQGIIVEKCPTAGCWFYLQDDTGTIKVDTKAAGFVVVNVPLQTKVTVSGRIVNESEEAAIQATGLRY